MEMSPISLPRCRCGSVPSVQNGRRAADQSLLRRQRFGRGHRPRVNHGFPFPGRVWLLRAKSREPAALPHRRLGICRYHSRTCRAARRPFARLERTSPSSTASFANSPASAPKRSTRSLVPFDEFASAFSDTATDMNGLVSISASRRARSKSNCLPGPRSLPKAMPPCRKSIARPRSPRSRRGRRFSKASVLR